MVSAFNEKHYGPDVKHLCQMIKNHGAVRVVGIGELGKGLVRGSPNLKLIGELDSYGMVDASPFGAEEIEAASSRRVSEIYNCMKSIHPSIHLFTDSIGGRPRHHTMFRRQDKWRSAQVRQVR